MEAAPNATAADWRDKIVAFPPRLVARYQSLGLWGSRTIGEEFTAIAEEFPDRPAVIDPTRHLSFRELDERSNAVAASLPAMGFRRGDRMIFQTANTVEAVEAWYGCLKAGVVPVCSLPIHGRHEVDAIVENTGAKGHIVDAGARDGAVLELALDVRRRTADYRVITTGGEVSAADAHLTALASSTGSLPERSSEYERITPDDLAILQLSGGTTATPKAIPRLHAESWYNAKATAWRYPIRSGERVAHVLPIIHNAGLHSALHAAHAVGATVLVCGPQPDEFIPFLREQRADSVLLVPGIVSTLLEREDFCDLLPQLRRLSLSAAVVPAELFDRLEALGVPVVQQFGMGEGLCSAMSLSATRTMRKETVGYALSSEDEFLIVDEHGRELPDGETGELWVRGPYTIRGYWNDPERNAVAFSPNGFYKTGDVISVRVLDGKRCLVIGGRIKDLINRGGEKVNAEEVEDAVRRHPGVREVAVVAMPDARLGERGCAYVVPRSPSVPPTLADITALLGEIGMAKYKWPERVEYVESLPRTPIGKVQKAHLRALIASKLEEERRDANR